MEKRPLPNTEDQNGEELNEEIEIEIEQDIEETKSINGDELLSEKIKPKNQKNQTSKNESDNLGNDNNDEEHINVDGEIVLTHTADRGMDTMFHTIDFKEDNEVLSIDLKNHKEYIKNQFDKWVKVSF